MEVIARIEEYLQTGEIYPGLPRDVSALLDRLRTTAKVAFTDTLTDAPNRAALVSEWPVICAGRPTIALMDLDGFKGVNDTYGHAAGDEVLRCVASRLRQTCSVFFRLGGDEFVFTLPTDMRLAVVFARHTADAISEPIKIRSGEHVHVGASIGLSRFTSDDLKQMLTHADAAMYRAKLAKCGISVFNMKRDRWMISLHERRPSTRRRDSR